MSVSNSSHLGECKILEVGSVGTPDSVKGSTNAKVGARRVLREFSEADTSSVTSANSPGCAGAFTFDGSGSSCRSSLRSLSRRGVSASMRWKMNSQRLHRARALWSSSVRSAMIGDPGSPPPWWWWWWWWWWISGPAKLSRKMIRCSRPAGMGNQAPG